MCRAGYSKLCWVFAAGIFLACAPIQAMADTLTYFNPATGLFKIRHHTADLVDAEFTFWRKDWEWLRLDAQSKAEGQKRRIEWHDANSGLAIEADMSQEKPGRSTWRMKLRADPQRGADLYGGIIFRISKAALKEMGLNASPQIRPDNMGWTLDLGTGGLLSVTFDKPVARLEFERGDLGEIRAYLLLQNSKADAAELLMTVAAPGAIGLPTSERLAKKSAAWRQHVLHWNRSPVDLSFLNAPEKPAGQRGFLRVDGEKFRFDDGTEARLWGTNLAAYAIFHTSPPELVRNQAKRLSQLGFNLVRIHHHDSSWVSPNVFDTKTGGTRALNAHALARLDWWIACLKAEGIYVWLDLHVGREVTAKDQIDAFDEISGGQSRGKIVGFSYINDTLRQRMKEFAESYVTHVNEFTGTAYKDEPAIVALLLTNENDLSHHFGNSLLPDKNVPWHTARYMALAKEFAARHALDPDQVWRSWEFGPSKLFLADLEHRFHTELIGHLRQVGVKAPVIGTNFWGQMTLAGLPSLAAGDFIDAHSYGGANEVENNPRYKPGMVSWIGAAAVAGKPLTVSEWNLEPFPAFDRAHAPLHLAAIASLQGWNALMQFAYSQSPMSGTIGPGNWDAFNDPALIATLPAAALLYRQGHVTEGAVTHYLQLPASTITGQNISPLTSRAIRTLVERSRFRIKLPRIPELEWLEPSVTPSDATIIETADYDAVEPGASLICSDTGEICRDWNRGILTVNTPKSQLASGWIGRKTVELADVTVTLETSNATVAIQSLDDAPISKAEKILISVAAQSIPLTPSRLPFFAEPVEGRLSIRARPGLKLHLLDLSGTKQPISVNRHGDFYDIQLTKAFTSFWGMLE
jgi:hypothetical protein